MPAWSTANDQPLYQPPGTWVIDTPAPSTATGPADAPLRTGYVDNQIRILPDGTQETYTATRIKILKPEALAIGNLSIVWLPDAGPITIHRVQLIRGGQTTDVLASTKFTVLQREEHLEQSMLTGERAATLQVPGLQVGDEIVVAATIARREPAFDGHVADLVQMPNVGIPGVFRFRLTTPRNHALVVRPTKDLPALQPAAGTKEDVFDYVMRDPVGAVPTEGAPPRFNVRRLIEFSNFGSWADVSARMAPLFDRAATLGKGSPIRAEAATIAAADRAPSARALAALRLVQDRIRYVFVGLNGGNYTPIAADETWTRRFGDCKAKTALLLALLRELGIKAQAALVVSSGGDGVDERLPSPRPFDHVIVRAEVPGKVLWLDGTRLGDRSLDTYVPPFRWALPITKPGLALERIPPRDTGYPMLTEIIDIDQSAGVDKDARVSFRNILRGDGAFATRMRLAALSKEDADRTLKSYWTNQASWLTPDQVGWSYDERLMALTLTAVGRGNPGWKGTATEGHRLDVIGAGLYQPSPLRRPQDQDQAAPWSVTFPLFRCWATTIRLPQAGMGKTWDLSADPMYRKLGGVTYWRAVGQDGLVVRTVMSTRSYETEASLREATIVNQAIPTFNDAMSRVSERPTTKDETPRKQTLPYGEQVNWLEKPAPCSPGS